MPMVLQFTLYMKGLRITYLLPDFDEGAHSGGIYVIFQHCNGLIYRGHTVRVFNNVGKKSRYLRLECPVERHNNDPSLIEDNAPHIIVGTHWRTYFLLTRMKKAVKNGTGLCLLVQSDDRRLVNEDERPLVSKALTDLYEGDVPVHKIAVSSYVREMLRDDFGQESIYARNGLEVHDVDPLLGPAPAGRVRIAARYDTSSYRGWTTVDRVLEKIARERDDVEIHLFEMKKKRPTKYRSFYHKGLVGRELLRLFKSCDIYVAASRHEGFSYPAIEAMSQGACVCCADAGGTREFCIDGETALVSRQGDEDGLYGNMRRLLGDRELRDRLRAGGLRKAKEFTWEGCIDTLEEFFRSISGQSYRERRLSSSGNRMEDGALPDNTHEHQPPGAATHGNARERQSPSGTATHGNARERQGRTAAVRDGGRKAYVVYDRDPFSDYRDWLNVDETVRCLADAGLRVDTFLYVDAHRARSAAERLKMLARRDSACRFNAKIFYTKRVRLRLPALYRVLFSASVLFALARSCLFSAKKDCAAVISSSTVGRGAPLQWTCRFLRIPFFRLPCDDPRLKAYSFPTYTKESAAKEREYRGLLRELMGIRRLT